MKSLTHRITTLLKGGVVAAIFADIKFNIEIAVDLYRGKVCIPDKEDHTRITIAWITFIGVAIVTAIIQVWDMVGEIVEKGDCPKLEPYLCRLPIECEVFFVNLFEGIPQAAILLYLLFRYGIVLRCPYPFKTLTIESLIMDLISSNSRFGMALARFIAGVKGARARQYQYGDETSGGRIATVQMSNLNAIQKSATASTNEEQTEEACKECFCLCCCRGHDMQKKGRIIKGMVISMIVLDIISLLALLSCSATFVARVHLGPPLNFTRSM